MSTTIRWSGQTATFNYPRELRHYGYPKAPLQPIANFSDLLTNLKARLNDGHYGAILTFPIEEYVSVSLTDIADIDTDKLDGLKLFLQGLSSLPTTLLGPTQNWIADGTPRPRAAFD